MEVEYSAGEDKAESSVCRTDSRKGGRQECGRRGVCGVPTLSRKHGSQTSWLPGML